MAALARAVLVVILSGVLAGAPGCASAPVQEMSDARQMLQSAERAGAPRHAPEPYARALRLLEEAERELEIGRYGKARRLAREAAAAAAEARARAEARGGP